MARCAIAIGSNLGDSLQIVADAIAQLNSNPQLEVVQLSRWYKTKAVTKLITRTVNVGAGLRSPSTPLDSLVSGFPSDGFDDLNGSPQPDFINGCAIAETSLSPLAILALLLELEKNFGRQRRKRWDARTLDLDLLLYDDLVLELPELILPHPRMGDRAFVMLPLVEIAPDWWHPIFGKTIAELALDPPDLNVCQPIPLEQDVSA
ncbi:2-amino-4-hydroxy-6-hydroxymethyldihydropteridin epyrophosphokinase [Thalassoporum mexicanum PCC 7367]|uniref:2-amino-4-hydroxy-6- hydroxymethyldihydropteridine diphosphokinase n=1 Tax=Thalassoporum mexicanum TaxID=3457544 RepID=UPI00029FB408|nr:2-amino-4-hydroxy-6-hydroxymethyldihydropteridine diphosphokinase [Pseudanabaena sp. PCC 7367]AFY70514.1 2-amino-4-hydroxy-6-hydroxymethyldihydropteridin epyrophosphokinase [Pseudanabaena sp. PCC 7367]